jgi:hypothetical protein
VRDTDLDLTRMKQLADRTDTLFFNNRGGRTVESHLECTFRPIKTNTDDTGEHENYI